MLSYVYPCLPVVATVYISQSFSLKTIFGYVLTIEKLMEMFETDISWHAIIINLDLRPSVSIANA
jgi:hypothetical protein